VIDITYDHLLAKTWHHYADEPFDNFIDRFHAHARLVSDHYPEPARTFLTRLIGSRHLMNYHSLLGLEEAFQRLDRRLSYRVRRKENTLAYLPIVKEQIMYIEKDFSLFMPDLIDHFISVSGLTFDDHWLKRDSGFKPALFGAMP
jgi:acyl carrier protein phosphodiesterase